MPCSICNKVVTPAHVANFNVLTWREQVVHLDCADVQMLRDAREELMRQYWPDPTLLARISFRLERATKALRQELPAKGAGPQGASVPRAKSPYRLDLEFDDEDE